VVEVMVGVVKVVVTMSFNTIHNVTRVTRTVHMRIIFYVEVRWIEGSKQLKKGVITVFLATFLLYFMYFYSLPQ